MPAFAFGAERVPLEELRALDPLPPLLLLVTLVALGWRVIRRGGGEAGRRDDARTLEPSSRTSVTRVSGSRPAPSCTARTALRCTGLGTHSRLLARILYPLGGAFMLFVAAVGTIVATLLIIHSMHAAPGDSLAATLGLILIACTPRFLLPQARSHASCMLSAVRGGAGLRQPARCVSTHARRARASPKCNTFFSLKSVSAAAVATMLVVCITLWAAPQHMQPFALTSQHVVTPSPFTNISTMLAAVSRRPPWLALLQSITLLRGPPTNAHAEPLSPAQLHGSCPIPSVMRYDVYCAVTCQLGCEIVFHVAKTVAE